MRVGYGYQGPYSLLDMYVPLILLSLSHILQRQKKF